MSLVIIGGDAAGMSAASRARRIKPEAKIIVFEQSYDVSYSACGMPYNIADNERPIDDLIVRRAEVFKEKQGIDLRLGHRVQAIDSVAHIISGVNHNGEAFQCSYKKLIIATGASAKIPEIPGIDTEGVLTLNTLNDGRILKEYINTNNVSRAVIIGMGYIALEMAESLRNRNIEVVMVKPRKRILPWMNEDLSAVIIDELKRNHVVLHPGHTIEAIKKRNSDLIVQCDEFDLDCQLILPAISVAPNSKLAIEAGLKTEIDNAISIDRYTRTSDPDIYAAGDCADSYHVVTGKKTWIPLALHANREGRVAADNIFGDTIELQGIAGSAIFKVFNLEVAKTGLNNEEALKHGFDPIEITVTTRSRAHAHPGNKSIHICMIGDKKSRRLLGAQMVGGEGVAHRIHGIAVALHNHMTVDDFWQCDLAYAPPFGPAWDPMLTAASQLMKEF